MQLYADLGKPGRDKPGRRRRAREGALVVASALTAATTLALAGGAAASPSRTTNSTTATSGTTSATNAPVGMVVSANTATPIKHVVVIIGENNTFDTVFATYKPVKDQTVDNLRSEGIVAASGAPGPNYAKAAPRIAVDLGNYTVNPKLTGTYPTLPQPSTTSISPSCDNGLKPNTPDSRFPANLPAGPYQITKYVPYLDSNGGATGRVIGAYVGSPLHRFYQMWQQVNVGHNLYTWVQMTAGDSNGVQPPRSRRARSTRASTTWQRATPPASSSWPTTIRCPTTTTRR